MKKVLLIAAAVLALASARAALAAPPAVGIGGACTTNAQCNSTAPDPATNNHCGCPDTTPGAPAVPPSSACGELDLFGSFGGPTVLEVAGCASQASQDGCISILETVDLSGAGPGECDSAANAACAACGCGVCDTGDGSE